MKKTIAIVGATEKNGKEIIAKFASAPYRLLLISNEANELEHFGTDITAKYPGSDIETLDCVKDGCWEADIIILAVPPEKIVEITTKFKEVATQKIVIEMWGNETNSEELKKILPYSKLVSISGFCSPKITISGEDKTVNEEIKKIFILAGFCVSDAVDNIKKS
ncbi:NAD(P)-binding domain-containing protein [Hanamia caeni]|uniref:NAD(P)-binding domain-containing protein n=1 Tax=Hanamia caeni TaxID=2294116 RepID=UPI001313F2E3|nr:NAD(P)-binding domain-containing protein [Hanamia caeni]